MPTISAKVQSMISEEIISGEFPPGTKLDERWLAERYKVSRTPVREALRQLASRGLTQILPMRGVVVMQIGVKELSEILHADCELEAVCARLAAESMTSMEKTDLEFVHRQSVECVKKKDVDGYLELNRELHRLILEGAHNEVLTKMVSDIRERLSPYRTYHPAESDRLESSHASHDALVKAILDGNGEQAYLTMREHNAHLGNAALRAIRHNREKLAEKELAASSGETSGRLTKGVKAVKAVKADKTRTNGKTASIAKRVKSAAAKKPHRVKAVA